MWKEPLNFDVARLSTSSILLRNIPPSSLASLHSFLVHQPTAETARVYSVRTPASEEAGHRARLAVPSVLPSTVRPRAIMDYLADRKPEESRGGPGLSLPQLAFALQPLFAASDATARRRQAGVQQQDGKWRRHHTPHNFLPLGKQSGRRRDDKLEPESWNMASSMPDKVKAVLEKLEVKDQGQCPPAYLNA